MTIRKNLSSFRGCHFCSFESIIAELAKKIVVTHQAEKIWMYDRTTVQGATFNMRGELYRGHANATALFSSPVVSALGSESDDPGSSPGRGKALCP